MNVVNRKPVEVVVLYQCKCAGEERKSARKEEVIC